ncbi:MAG: aldehyde dehydrogenase family protein [Alphaproteobacteria bacterium]|nr:aldehyde dehydrogenase family protein [Alphaproteobacteria bacterium]
MVHVPILRHGTVYTSLDTAPVPQVFPGREAATVSLANAAMVRRDLRRLDAARAALRAMGARARIDATVRAADLFLHAALPVGDDLCGPDAYVRDCAASTGLPEALVRANMAKVAYVCRELPTILRGLMRGLDVDVLDTGLGEQDGVLVGLVPTTRALAAVLPSNSPGVHSLWIPALALGTPVVLKPGSGDPFTPLRVVQALIAAGLPAEAFGFYPADRAVGNELVELHDRVLVFGGPDVARRYAGRPGVSVHGPGFAKVLVGDDHVDAWADDLDLLVASVASNGGRSCINASTIVVPRHADALAHALATRLAALEPRPLDDPEAGLAAFADAGVARAISASIDDRLGDDAVDVSAAVRPPERATRVVTRDGLTWLRPTVVRCPPDHPLARTEFGFPFVAVVEVPEADAVDWLGPTLVCAALTDDRDLARRLVDAGHIDRLHLGAVATSSIRWDQPHEGNLFEWLWRRRAVALGPG